MIKKIASFIFIAALILGGLAAWLVFGSNTSFTEDKKSLYIKTNSSFANVENTLGQEGFVKNSLTFKWMASLLKYDKNVKAGKYVFEKGASVYQIIKTIKSGRQTPVNFVINKLRTKENLAQKMANNFECDSAAVIALLNNNDSLSKYGLDSNTAMTAIIPNTYSMLWNTSAARVFKKLYEEQEKFWNTERKAKAAAMHLTPNQVYTIASIVEEETNMPDDKGKIASVYINRMQKGMRLGADPTVKFALKDFGLKRIYNKHLSFPSPYNTYLNAGLPPGPICTPSSKTIDAVLNAPSTDYIYFVAKPDLRGYSNFASNYEEHMRFAKAYQQALDSIAKARQAK